MSGLVGYASSDEEDDVPVERPAKVAKTDAQHATGPTAAPKAQPQSAPTPSTAPAPASAAPISSDHAPKPETIAPTAPSAGPGPAPSAPPPQDPEDSTFTPPPSPYTTERTLLRNLTMPTHPNFSLPRSPSPPPANSEAALHLSTTTKKFTRFLDLKAQKQPLHFNARLENSTSLRNPGLLAGLMEFAGVSEEESRASTLGVDVGGAPSRWPEEWFVENLVRENERRERKRRRERGEVEFVKGGGDGMGSKGSSKAGSKAGTPKGGGSGREHRKSRFDR